MGVGNRIRRTSGLNLVPHLSLISRRVRARDNYGGTLQVVLVVKVQIGAEGGSRTRTSFRTTDFKSAASAIPPPRHVVRKPNSTKRFRFLLIINS